MATSTEVPTSRDYSNVYLVILQTEGKLYAHFMSKKNERGNEVPLSDYFEIAELTGQGCLDCKLLTVKNQRSLRRKLAIASTKKQEFSALYFYLGKQTFPTNPARWHHRIFNKDAWKNGALKKIICPAAMRKKLTEVGDSVLVFKYDNLLAKPFSKEPAKRKKIENKPEEKIAKAGGIEISIQPFLSRLVNADKKDTYKTFECEKKWQEIFPSAKGEWELKTEKEGRLVYSRAASNTAADNEVKQPVLTFEEMSAKLTAKATLLEQNKDFLEKIILLVSSLYDKSETLVLDGATDALMEKVKIELVKAGFINVVTAAELSSTGKRNSSAFFSHFSRSTSEESSVAHPEKGQDGTPPRLT